MNTLQICKVTFSILLSCLLLSKFAVCRQLTLFVPVFFMRNVVILKSIDEDNNWVGLVFTLFFYVHGDQKTLGHKVPNPTSPNFYELWNILAWSPCNFKVLHKSNERKVWSWHEYKLIKITESEGTQTELMTNKRVIN